MSGFLLDTNIPLELTKLMPEPRVSAWVDAQDNASLYLSVVSVGELRFYRASPRQTANAGGTVV
jgi:predicted nucleic acid-binding protein